MRQDHLIEEYRRENQRLKDLLIKHSISFGEKEESQPTEKSAKEVLVSSVLSRMREEDAEKKVRIEGTPHIRVDNLFTRQNGVFLPVSAMNFPEAQVIASPLHPMSRSSKKRRSKLPEYSTSVLKKWLFEHWFHPYPAEEEKAILCNQTNLTLNQINNWFTNARRRILPRSKAPNTGTPHYAVIK